MLHSNGDNIDIWLKKEVWQKGKRGKVMDAPSFRFPRNDRLSKYLMVNHHLYTLKQGE